MKILSTSVKGSDKYKCAKDEIKEERLDGFQMASYAPNQRPQSHNV